jgi:hypothetical protein
LLEAVAARAVNSRLAYSQMMIHVVIQDPPFLRKYVRKTTGTTCWKMKSNFDDFRNKLDQIFKNFKNQNYADKSAKHFTELSRKCFDHSKSARGQKQTMTIMKDIQVTYRFDLEPMYA